jgi:DNA repair protein RadC
VKNDTKLTIKNWAESDRPREKLIEKGRHSLSDAELIAILIGSGTKDLSAVELAKQILHKNQNDLNKLGKQSIKELMQNKGIGEAKAISIIAALELGIRRQSKDFENKIIIKNSSDAYNYIHTLMADLLHEEFWVFYLNRANAVIHKNKIGQGGVNATVVDIRIILKTAIEHLAVGIIVCHNHPSGNILPSNADKLLTKNLKEAALLMDIKLIDHIIYGQKKYFSFSDEGIL